MGFTFASPSHTRHSCWMYWRYKEEEEEKQRCVCKGTGRPPALRKLGTESTEERRGAPFRQHTAAARALITFSRKWLNTASSNPIGGLRSISTIANCVWAEAGGKEGGRRKAVEKKGQNSLKN